MLSRVEFVAQVGDAYEHLYDLVNLRTHPLANVFIPNLTLSRKDKAWQLHHILLRVIDEISPGSQAPIFSREWRRHRLMVLHYLDGLDPQSVADELGISRRHYYRDHKLALEAVAGILWERYVLQRSPTPQESQIIDEQNVSNHLELLRLEAARSAQADRYANLTDVINGVLLLLRDKLNERSLSVELVLPRGLPSISVKQSLLRQMLLGITGYLIENVNSQSTIRLIAHSEATNVQLSLVVDCPLATGPISGDEAAIRMSALEEMAMLSNAQILPVRTEGKLIGFQIQLPVDPQQTVLVVDDNQDILELFHRYLTPHNYHVVGVQTPQDTIYLARQVQPFAIILDLMMPGQDGWDLLQALLNQPDTSHIPIIICSVLRQKELALFLGATAFLEKPVSEQAILSALTALTAK